MMELIEQPENESVLPEYQAYFEERVRYYEQYAKSEVIERAVALEIETGALVLSNLKVEQELQTINENQAIIIKKLVQLGVL